MGKKSQQKGRSGEIELCSRLRDYGFDVRPGKAVSYGSTPDLVGLASVHVEVKRTERLNLYSAMEQSQRDSIRFKDGLPTVFHRKNRRDWLVTMTLDDWIKIYNKSILK